MCPINERRRRIWVSAAPKCCNRHTGVQYISAAVMFGVGSLFDDVMSVEQVM